MLVMMKRSYRVLASDPDNDWRCAELTVRAISDDEAKRVARAELATQKRDDWSISYVSAA